MKSSIVLVILAVLAGYEASVVRVTSSRANLNAGYIYPGDRLLLRQYAYQPAIPNTVQYRDVMFRGNYSTRISAVQATEVGYTQYATAWIVAGGVGRNNVTVRTQSARGYGYYYLIDVWGR